MRSYDYAHRRGVRPLSWDDVAALSARLAEQLEPAGVEVIVGIARAGLIPATLVAGALRRELYPVRVTRRVNDEVTFAAPVWRVPLSAELSDRVVAVVDEIADSGETLALVAAGARERGASRVLTACLVSHSWASPPPDLAALVSDALIFFPWDRQVLVSGQWKTHPEMLAALAAQSTSPPAGQEGDGNPAT
jgi:hypoxanthine phosphoribosyltransferase